LGLDDLLSKCPSTILRPGDFIDRLTLDAAEELNLPRSVKVIQGGADAYVGAYGLNVTRPGDSGLLTGSSHLQLTIVNEPFFRKGVFGSFRDILFPQEWLIDAGLAATGSIINWFRKYFCHGKSYEELTEEANEIPIGSDNLVILDHFQGNRSPYADSDSRGNINGLTLKHTPAHIFRGIMESVGFGMRAIQDSYGDCVKIDKIKAAGGASKSKLWMQIHSDILGVPIEIPKFNDASLMGSAVLAFYGAEQFSSIREGANAMVKTGDIIEPNMQHKAEYEGYYRQYCQLYDALKSIRKASHLAQGEDI
jgi:ribulose kinase